MILTSEANSSNLQKELKTAVSREFFFRNTATKTWTTTKRMVDYIAIQKILNEKYIHFFTFYTRADKPVTAITRHLPGNISPEDITVTLQETDYDMSVKQMTAKIPVQKEGSHTCPSPLPSYTSKESKSCRSLQIDNTL
jgi:hypothetical protein